MRVPISVKSINVIVVQIYKAIFYSFNVKIYTEYTYSLWLNGVLTVRERETHTTASKPETEPHAELKRKEEEKERKKKSSGKNRKCSSAFVCLL